MSICEPVGWNPPLKEASTTDGTTATMREDADQAKYLFGFGVIDGVKALHENNMRAYKRMTTNDYNGLIL